MPIRLLVAGLLLPTVAAAQAVAQPAASAGQAPRPEIQLRVPSDGATVGRTFSVAFGLRHFGVAPAGVNMTSTGHFHLLINVDAPAAGTVIPTDSLHRHFGSGAIETSVTLAPGTYTLRAVLGDFEHKVISRDLVSAPVRITVRP